MALQKRTISFDIIYDDTITTDPCQWDYDELLNLWDESLQNLTVNVSPMSPEDIEAYKEDNWSLDDDEDD